MANKTSDLPTRVIVINGNNTQGLILFRLPLIIDLIKHHWKVIVISPASTEAIIFNQVGAKHYPVSLQPNKKNFLYDLYTLGQYRRCIKLYKPAVIINYTIKPNVYMGFLASIYKINYINVVTGLGSGFLGKKLIRLIIANLYKLTFKKASKVIFLNQRDMRYFRRYHFVQPSQIILMPGEGIDLNFYQPISTASPNKLCFIYIGRLIADKGVNEYYAAAKEIKRTHPEIEFQLLGPLDEFNQQSIGKTQLKKWINSGIIHYLGTTTDVRPFIANASCLVLPSYAEGLSRILLEACAMEKPVIATNVAGCREIIDDGINGYLCQPRNVQSLVTAMKKIVSLNQTNLIEMGKQGRKKVMEKFSNKIVLQQYALIIKETVNIYKSDH